MNYVLCSDAYWILVDRMHFEKIMSVCTSSIFFFVEVHVLSLVGALARLIFT